MTRPAPPPPFITRTGITVTMADTQFLALRPGTRIESFEIREILGTGGFGITYKAWDHQLHCDVAIKEFLPRDLAVRGDDLLTVTARTGADDDQENFETGLEKFLAEARTLARFRNPNVVSVKQFISANGTAYLIMDYEQGTSLADHIKSGAGPIPQDRLREILDRLLVGLRDLHAQKILHRDIKPGNIFLRASGEPVLLDFGSAREVPRDRTVDQEMTSMVSLGYAPYEQYNRRGNQGPWTDLYSLGATMYFCATGKKPVDGMDRYIAAKDGWPDPMPAASVIAAGNYDPLLLGVIDWMLRVDIGDRPRDSDQVMRVLSGTEPLPETQTGDNTVVTATTIADTVALNRDTAGSVKPASAAHPARSTGGDRNTVTGTALAGLGRLTPVAAGIAGVLVITLAAWWWLDSRIESGFSETLAVMSRDAVQVDARVGQVDASIFGRRVVMRGVQLTNPEGYQTPHMIDVDDVTIEFASRFWWAADTRDITAIRVSAPRISYERNPDTRRSNIATVTESGTDPEDDQDGVLYRVDALTIDEGELQAVSINDNNEVVTRSVPALGLSAIGTEEPLTGSGLVRKVVLALGNDALTAAKSSPVIRRVTGAPSQTSPVARPAVAGRDSRDSGNKDDKTITDKLKSLFSKPPGDVFNRKESDF